MSSAVSICNTALYKIGASPIVSLTDATEAARACNHFYPLMRDAVLRAFPWNFALAYLDFGAPLSTGPAFEFGRAYALPVNPYVLRVLEASERSIRFRIIGRQLYTDELSIACKCIVRVESEADFDALFTQALSARLAAELSWPLTKSDSTQKAMWQLYQATLAEAFEIDSQEGTSYDLEIDDVFLVRTGR